MFRVTLFVATYVADELANRPLTLIVNLTSTLLQITKQAVERLVNVIYRRKKSVSEMKKF